MNLSEHHALDFTLTALCVWRESRGQPLEAKKGVAWVIRNRTIHPGWWGKDWATVILHPYQFSSFNQDDPNAVKWPVKSDPAWLESIMAAKDAWEALTADPVDGATNYHDVSVDPAWTRKMLLVKSVGKLKFYKEK